MQLKNLLKMKEKSYITLVNTYDLILLSGGNAQNATSEQLGQTWMDHTSDNSYFFIYREKWGSTWHKKVWWKGNAKACEPTPSLNISCPWFPQWRCCTSRCRPVGHFTSQWSGLTAPRSSCLHHKQGPSLLAVTSKANLHSPFLSLK